MTFKIFHIMTENVILPYLYTELDNHIKKS